MTTNRFSLFAVTALCSIVAVTTMLAPTAASAKKHRVGGKVHRTWPQGGHRPHSALTRWLARQVGPRCPTPKQRKGHKGKSRRKCKVSGGKKHKAHRRSRSAGVARIAAGDMGGLSHGVARISADAGGANPIALTRSYEIPADDPSYARLLNWSWTYDSATAAAAFIAAGEKAQATQLLDQLAALQYKDGSIEIAFNVSTGNGAGVYRSGSVAWIGLAAASYDTTYATDRYRSMELRAADYLLSLQGSNGLVRGGPGVAWYSTQHNLLAYTLLARLGDELAASGDSGGALRYRTAAAAISSSIDSNLIYQDNGGAHFYQGYNDAAEALDTQTIGAMYLVGRNQPDLALRVLAYAQLKFAVSGRSIVKSSDKATYNKTYAASGPFSGYLPSRSGGPYLMTFEGTATMRQAMAALGQDTSAIDKGAAAWRAISSSSSGAPVQADRTFTDSTYEFHVWPSAAAASWWLLAQNAPGFFSAPIKQLSPTIVNWSKIRSPSLISTYTDGRVDMNTGAGERRVLAAGSAGSDYTIAATATLQSGDGWGIMLRSTIDAQTNLTGYVVQLDKNFGQVILRQRDTESELSVPLARVNVPSGFTWDGVPHLLSTTINGNTLTASLDGAPLLSVPDLAAASATARGLSSGVTKAFTPPTSGGYGLRAWNSAVVQFQSATVN
jgi:hypothetical protein